MDKILRRSLSGLLLVLLAFPVSAAGPPGSDRLAYALTGGRVIVSPGHVVDPGVVVVRGGVIEAVGSRRRRRRFRPDARVIDVQGKVVHAAFIDPYVSTDRLAGKPPKRPADGRRRGRGRVVVGGGEAARRVPRRIRSRPSARRTA